mgnify:FL=1
MYDAYTFVEVPRKYADIVLKAMSNNVQIKGRTVNIEKAGKKKGRKRH